MDTQQQQVNERPTLPSIKTSSDENFAFLYQLGYSNAIISSCWKKYYNKKEKGRCQVCCHKMEMPKQVIKFYCMPYHKNKHYPPGHFIFNEEVEDTDPNVWENVKEYLKTKTNKEKAQLLIPVCYQCFNTTHNYSVHNLNLIEKSQTVNYNKLPLEELTEELKQEKLEYNYQYQFDWYQHYGYCIYTENAVKFCGCRSIPETLTCPKHTEYQPPHL